MLFVKILIPCYRPRSKEILNDHGHSITSKKATGSSMVWEGDKDGFRVDSKGHNFARFTVSDHADVHFGNVSKGNGTRS